MYNGPKEIFEKKATMKNGLLQYRHAMETLWNKEKKKETKNKKKSKKRKKKKTKKTKQKKRKCHYVNDE